MKRILFSLFLVCFMVGAVGAGGIPKHLVNKQGSTSVEHAYIHQGAMYTASIVFDTLADDASGQMLIDLASSTFTADHDEIHMFFSVAGGGDAFIIVHDSPTIVSSGTLVAAHNRNRDKGDESTALIYHTPSIPQLTVGTTLQHVMMPGGTGGNAGGGASERGNEFVFEKGRFYTVSVINKSGGAKIFSIDLEWYEVIE